MKLTIIDHPLVKHKLTLMREAECSTYKFRTLTTELGRLMAYEATRDFTTELYDIDGWCGPLKGERIKGKTLTVVPILRAGLGMMEGVLEHVPSARISVVGIYRNEETLEPVPYFQKLVSNIDERMALVVDPMLATGGSAVAAVDILKQWGVTKIKFVGLIGAPEGITRLHEAHPDVPIHLASVDERLNEHGYILPGLGDAGDRQFGT